MLKRDEFLMRKLAHVGPEDDHVGKTCSKKLCHRFVLPTGNETGEKETLAGNVEAAQKSTYKLLELIN